MASSQRAWPTGSASSPQPLRHCYYPKPSAACPLPSRSFPSPWRMSPQSSLSLWTLTQISRIQISRAQGPDLEITAVFSGPLKPLSERKLLRTLSLVYGSSLRLWPFYCPGPWGVQTEPLFVTEDGAKEGTTDPPSLWDSGLGFPAAWAGSAWKGL